MQEPVPGISATPDESNARYFKVIVAGPEGVFIWQFFIPLAYKYVEECIAFVFSSLCGISQGRMSIEIFRML